MRRTACPSWLLLLALAACPEAPVRPLPPPADVAPPPPLPHVPDGCEANLAGLYTHRDDGTFRYQVDDDGLNLRVHAFRQYGMTRVELPAAADIELHRTATGVHGDAKATIRNRLQKPCAVSFPYEMTACTPSALTLRAAQQLSLADDCQIEDLIHLNLVENVLVRVPGVDAGAALDAGPVAASDPERVDAGPAPVADAG